MITEFKRVAAKYPHWPYFLVASAMLAAWWMKEEL